MRRAGKTTFLLQLLTEPRAHLPPERVFFVSFDDDRLAELSLEQLGLLLEEYYRRFPELRGREKVHWFLDEIQLVPGWERFVRRVIDSELVEIVVSGSSARMLSREVHTSLRGRGMETVIRPFSFREYLTEGGFPEAQGLPPPLRVELLQGYVDTVLFRDVVERFGVSQVAALRWLVRQCLRNPAGAFSVHRLYLDLKAQGHGVAKDAVHAMLGHLLDAFLLSTVPIATKSERRRNSNPRKVYPVDPGLIGAFDASGHANLGHALETVVQNELERRKAHLGYVKTRDGLEVDFRARYQAGEEEIVQVCADPSAAATKDRELRAIAEGAAEYPRATRRLLVLSRDHAFPISVPPV